MVTLSSTTNLKQLGKYSLFPLNSFLEELFQVLFLQSFGYWFSAYYLPAAFLSLSASNVR